MDPTKDFITVDDLEGHPMHLLWMSGDEMLGGHMCGMFEYRIELSSTHDNIKAKDVLGKKLTISVKLPDGSGFRYFNGHLTSWSYRGTHKQHTIYQATLHPWLWFLNFTADCRIFNKKSVIGIVNTVFSKYQNADSEQALGAEYPAYEYVVQYRETDFNLVCRLLQQEGVYFYFRHEKNRHVLVLADESESHKASPGHEEIPYLPDSASGKEDRPHFYQWKASEEMQLRSYLVHDYDYQNARADLLAVRHADPKQQHVFIGEFFDYPGRYLVQGSGETIAGLRLDEHHEDGQSIEVEGNTVGLAAGHSVKLTNPPWSDKAIDFLVVSAHYELRMPDTVSEDVDEDEPPFAARYGLFPAAEQFRPRRVTAKPAIVGPQTAVVVGKNKTANPEPEEIVTDEYGRVRVRFHWERIGDRHPDIRGPKDDEEESKTCWVRVAQMWAGSRWGSIHIPRVGHEVVVEFLEGDPDRPLITGSVYNNVNMPPYDLPAHKTQSGIKSRSTLNGNANNYNEIRFEDFLGQEELHIQAEKDMTTLVKNNQSTSVGADRSLDVSKNETVTIGINRTESVGGDEKIDITGNRTETVGADESVTVSANQTLTVGASRTKSVGASETVTIGATSTETITAMRAVTIGGAYQLTVGGAINETVGAVKAEEIGGAKSVNVGAASSENIAGKKSVTAGGSISATSGGSINMQATSDIAHKAGASFFVDATNQVSIKCGSATLVMKKNGDITINGKKISVKGSGDVVLKGSNITEN